MSNQEPLFAEINPSEEANLSGGRRGPESRGGLAGSAEVNADATATVDITGTLGDSSRSTVFTVSDAFVDENRIFGRASSIVRVVL
ncbi:hypothetical protein [Myxosarcina sp. GI1(2024)]